MTSTYTNTDLVRFIVISIVIDQYNAKEGGCRLAK